MTDGLFRSWQLLSSGTFSEGQAPKHRVTDNNIPCQQQFRLPQRPQLPGFSHNYPEHGSHRTCRGQGQPSETGLSEVQRSPSPLRRDGGLSMLQLQEDAPRLRSHGVQAREVRMILGDLGDQIDG